MAKKDFMAAAQMYQMKEKEFDPSADTVSKLPVNISGGKEALPNFMNIPIDKLVPYRAKNGYDFTRYGPVLEEAMVNSVRNYGIIEPISVRPMDSGEFEILAGESRWLAAKKVGLVKIPCHILDVDDLQADAIFAATNLIRRDMSYKDRINGWWRYTEGLRKQDKLSELRRALDENEQLIKTVVDGESLGWRQIMRYASCHNLIDQWVERLDSRGVGFMVAYQIAQFPKDIQVLLLNYHFTEAQIKAILDVYRKSTAGDTDVTWKGEETIEDILKVSPQKNLPRGVRNSIVKAAVSVLHEEDYSKAADVISKALTMYYESVNSHAREENSEADANTTSDGFTEEPSEAND